MLHEERDFATNRHEQCGLVGDNTALVGCQCSEPARRAGLAGKARLAGGRAHTPRESRSSRLSRTIRF
jgi:hypothetical protein